MLQARQIQTKLFLDLPATEKIDQSPLIPIFHRWIREATLPGLLIDVADYRHVPQGPGIMLIADHAHFAVDEGDDNIGLLCSVKRDAVGDAGKKVVTASDMLLQAAAALNKESDFPWNFTLQKLQVKVMDRLFVTTQAEAAEFAQLAASSLQEAYGSTVGSATAEALGFDGRSPAGCVVQFKNSLSFPGISQSKSPLKIL